METLLIQFSKVSMCWLWVSVRETFPHAGLQWEWRRACSMSTLIWLEIMKDWEKTHKENGVSPSSLSPSEEGLEGPSDLWNVFPDVFPTSKARVQSHLLSKNGPLLVPQSYLPFSEPGKQIRKSNSWAEGELGENKEQKDSLSLSTVHRSRPELGKGR